MAWRGVVGRKVDDFRAWYWFQTLLLNSGRGIYDFRYHCRFQGVVWILKGEFCWCQVMLLNLVGVVDYSGQFCRYYHTSIDFRDNHHSLVDTELMLRPESDINEV